MFKPNKKRKNYKQFILLALIALIFFATTFYDITAKIAHTEDKNRETKHIKPITCSNPNEMLKIAGDQTNLTLGRVFNKDANFTVNIDGETKSCVSNNSIENSIFSNEHDKIYCINSEQSLPECTINEAINDDECTPSSRYI